MRRFTWQRRLLGGIWLALLLTPLLPTPLAAQQKQPVEKTSVLAPERTDAGEWSGTWYYKTFKEKWALWIREENGIPEVKFQYQNVDQGENFITDWMALSHYASDGKKGLFKMTFERSDENLVAGDWFWQLGTVGVDRSVRTETASFEMYRAAQGRQLVLWLNDFERVYEGGKVYRMAAQQAWTFHKASRRLARWQELPF